MVMPTTSFYLPDDVAQQLECYKDRINVSRVCANAVKQEIHYMQLLERSVQNADANIERLRQEKARAHAEDVHDGRSDAAKHVKEISYTALRAIGARVELSRELEAWLEEKFHDEHDGESEDLMPDFAIWKAGWLSFMREYWAQVKDQL
jgi:hypothetical protein